MRIMLDTNVIISVLLFANSRMTNMMNYIFTTHRLVLSDYIMDELKYVATRKFPSKYYAFFYVSPSLVRSLL